MIPPHFLIHSYVFVNFQTVVKFGRTVKDGPKTTYGGTPKMLREISAYEIKRRIRYVAQV